MKKIMLLAFASALTLGSFAANTDKGKGKKNKKSAKTEHCCSQACAEKCTTGSKPKCCKS